jgi:hypothetical protein
MAMRLGGSSGGTWEGTREGRWNPSKYERNPANILSLRLFWSWWRGILGGEGR